MLSQKTDRARAAAGGVECPRIVLAEDDLEMRKLLAWSLRRRGYDVIECPDGHSLQRQLGLGRSPGHAAACDLLITDIRMPGESGLQLLEQARESVQLPPVILITAFPDEEVCKKARQLGAAALLAKPFDVADLLCWVGHVIEAAPSGDEQEPEPRQSGPAPAFPLQIVFRHGAGAAPLRSYVRAEAAVLSRFSEHITWCRVIVDRAPRNKGGQSHVVIVLGVVRRTLVVRHDSALVNGSETPYAAIQAAFETARGELRRWQRKRHDFGHEAVLPVES